MQGMNAARVGNLIATYGNTLVIPGRINTSVTAIVETRLDEIRKNIREADLANAQGRIVLFYLTPEDAAKIPNGVLLSWQGEQFTLGAPRTDTFHDVPVLVSRLGASGGYG